MKKYLGLLGVAIAGGLIAIGISNFFNKQNPSVLYAEQHAARYASLTEGATKPDFVEVADVVTPTVVHIITTIEASQQQQGADPFGFFGFPMPNMPRSGSGSGVIISNDGYIVTNNHVIDGATKIKVVLNDKREFDAELLGKDPNTDLALLRIDEKNLPFAMIGNSDEVKVGQWVLAVGNPFNLTSTVTAGIVSAKGRNLNLLRDPNRPESQYSIESFIQTDAAVNPGNSGGALVASDGKLVGINTAIASQTGQYAGYAFAVPSNLMKKVIDDLLKYGEVQRGFLGVSIQDINAQLADKEGLREVKGVFVAKVNPNSAAEDAGIKDKDVIVKIGEVSVNSSSELQEQVGKRNPGDVLKVTVLRDGKEKEFNVTLKNKEGKTGIVRSEKIENDRVLNSEFETVSREERLQLKISNGVKLKKADEKSILRKHGVPNGFIIVSIDKKPVYTPSDVKRALTDAKGGVLLEGINPDGSKGYYGFGIDK
ncbi:MAG: Do family serine endopeptidase [Bacteroidia bacterium]|jgi:Do/DeqQ family serine protease|nr:Do family serine endopeptidase [Bacteroidia bacterium]